MEAKARQERKAAKREQNTPVTDGMEEYTRMKEELYKKRQI